MFGKRHWLRFVTVILLVWIAIACQSVTPSTQPTTQAPAIAPTSQTQAMTKNNARSNQRSHLPQDKPDDALVDIQAVNAAIVLDMRYASTNNFMKRQLYPVSRCILRYAVAKQLAKVEIELVQQGLGLKVYDCYRPLSVQRQMWQVVSDERYVANPAKGSRHNRGSAVDVTLVDRDGKELEMPTEFDDFTTKAHRDDNTASPQARQHSQLLATTMTRYGFVPLATEWWHFDSEGWQNFPVTDVPLQSIPN
jgi:D-alanyl-D-alanine dipeptidase